MKNLNFITGFLAASCLFLLIGAAAKPSPNEEVPRYHITYQAGSGEATVYDAVTGEIELMKYAKVNDDSNIKDLLEKK
jgi:hypothetical protein